MVFALEAAAGTVPIADARAKWNIVAVQQTLRIRIRAIRDGFFRVAARVEPDNICAFCLAGITAAVCMAGALFYALSLYVAFKAWIAFAAASIAAVISALLAATVGLASGFTHPGRLIACSLCACSARLAAAIGNRPALTSAAVCGARAIGFAFQHVLGAPAGTVRYPVFDVVAVVLPIQLIFDAEFAKMAYAIALDNATTKKK